MGRVSGQEPSGNGAPLICEEQSSLWGRPGLQVGPAPRVWARTWGPTSSPCTHTISTPVDIPQDRPHPHPRPWTWINKSGSTPGRGMGGGEAGADCPRAPLERESLPRGWQLWSMWGGGGQRRGAFTPGPSLPCAASLPPVFTPTYQRLLPELEKEALPKET